MNVMQIYDWLPVSLQDRTSFCESWSYQQKSEYWNKQLREIVGHCYDTILYHQRVFDELGIDYRDIQTLNDIKALSVINVQTVKNGCGGLIFAGPSRKDLVRQHASGGIGTGSVFYMVKDAYAAEWAHMWLENHNAGLERVAWYGG